MEWTISKITGVIVVCMGFIYGIKNTDAQTMNIMVVMGVSLVGGKTYLSSLERRTEKGISDGNKE